MRKYYFQSPIVVLCSMFLLLGCQKDLSDTRTSSHVQDFVKADNGNKIRLISATSEFGDLILKYNTDGLLSTWYVEQINTTYHHEYDANGRLIKSFVYTGDDLTYTIHFFYDKNQVVREIWYNKNTTEIYDEVLYTFENGLATSMESPVQDYLVENTYSSQGNLLTWSFYFGSSLFAQGVLTYDHTMKNPYTAIPGLTYGYPFANGFSFRSKWYSVSESVTYYDEAGNIVFEGPQDPSKTTVQVGPQHYIAASNFYEVASASYVHFLFTYENCGSCEGKKEKSASRATGKSNLITKFLAKGSNKTMEQKVN